MAEGGTMEWIGKVADAINKVQLPRIAFALAVVTGAMLWLPDYLLAKMKVLSYRNAHLDWIALAFWLSAVFSVVSAFIWLTEAARGKKSKGSVKKHFLKRLEHLTPDEKGLLFAFVDGQTRTKELPSEHPTVMALFTAHVLFHPTQRYSPRFDYNVPRGLTFPMVYQMHETVWEILRERPYLLN